MAKGYIKLYRQIQEHWLFTKKPYDEAHAWIDLLLLANHEDTKGIFRGELIDYQRGTVYISLLELSERWGWTRKKVRCFLGALEKDQMLVKKGHSKGHTITIVNYDYFQGQGPTSVPTKVQQRSNKCTTNNNDKNDKNNIYTSPPKKDMFQEAIDRYNERVANGEYDLSGIEKENEDD